MPLHPKVLIGVPTRASGGYRPFDISLQALTQNRSDVEVFYSMEGVLPAIRNRIVRQAQRVGAEYIWWLDDDQPFFAGDPADPLRKNDLDALLAHNLDAVVPLSCRRGAPFLPLLYDHIHEGWIAYQRYLEDSEGGLIKVAGAGMGGLLIKTACFDKIGKDGWFEFVHPPGSFDDYAEDFPFYRKLQEAGVELYCDLEVRFGHAVTSVAYIMRQDGKWVTCLADKEPFVAFPQLKHPLAVQGVRRPQMVVT